MISTLTCRFRTGFVENPPTGWPQNVRVSVSVYHPRKIFSVIDYSEQLFRFRTVGRGRGRSLYERSLSAEVVSVCCSALQQAVDS
jgi:hypothetical protein